MFYKAVAWQDSIFQNRVIWIPSFCIAWHVWREHDRKSPQWPKSCRGFTDISVICHVSQFLDFNYLLNGCNLLFLMAINSENQHYRNFLLWKFLLCLKLFLCFRFGKENGLFWDGSLLGVNLGWNIISQRRLAPRGNIAQAFHWRI